MDEALVKVVQTALTIIGTLVVFIIYEKKIKKNDGSTPTLTSTSSNGYAKENSITRLSASLAALQKTLDETKLSNDTIDRIVSDLNKDMETVIHELKEIKILEIEELRVIKEVKTRLDIFGVSFEADVKGVHSKLDAIIKTADNIDRQTRG